MPPTPLFTQSELQRAFAFLLPPAHASTLAARWFADFASPDEVVDGWYVYPTAWAEQTPDASADVRAEDRAAWDATEVRAADERTFASFTEANIEDWLMRLRDLHLALVALVSPDAYERMRQVRGMSPREAARNRLQLERAVRAYRAARGWAAI